MMDQNVTVDLSAPDNEYSGVTFYGNYINTGAGGGALGENIYAQVGAGSTTVAQLTASAFSAVNNSAATVTAAYGSYISVGAQVNGGSIGQAVDVYGQISTFGGATITTGIEFYGADLSTYAITNPYYEWFDSSGVRRIREDATFNAVGQAIEALYNPQFTKYTPGAANYERIILGQWESDVAFITTENGGTGTLRNIAIDGAEVDLGTATHLVKINATTFKLGTLTCAVVATVLTCT